MPGRKDMSDLLSTPAKRPDLRRERGPGYRLSTEVEETLPAPEAVSSGNLENQKSTDEPQENAVLRIKIGYKLRKDLVKRLKRIADDEDRFVYQIMEDAFETYLATRATQQHEQ